MQVSTKNVLGYAFLPRILPRIRDLFSVAFSHTAYFIAMIFESVRLLPAEHPYLKRDYFGRYTVSQAIAEAFKRLKHDRAHIDQVLIFYVICFGILLFFAQIMITMFSVVTPFAFAGGTLVDPNTLDDEFGAVFTLSSMIETQRPENDIAFMLLDRVFGVPGMFGSRIEALPNFPFPYHFGLQAMFQTFSVAMLSVALLVLTYFVTTIIAETVRDGTPFGKRFNRVWAPIRLVAAFGLLVPMGSGLNAAQYIVLISANWGSSFATNALTYYYGEIADGPAGSTPFGQAQDLVATPNAQDPSNLIHFILTARACQYATQFRLNYHHGTSIAALDAEIIAYNEENFGHPRVSRPIDGYYMSNGDEGPEAVPMPGLGRAEFGISPIDADTATFEAIITDTDYESILIIFGTQPQSDPGLFSDHLDNLLPYCGSLTMPVVAPDDPMALEMQANYLNLIAFMWQDPDIIRAGAALAAEMLNPETPCDTSMYPIPGPDVATPGGGTVPGPPEPGFGCPPGDPPDMSEFKARKTAEYKSYMRGIIETTIFNNVDDLEWCGPEEDPYLLSYGWAGAAICYNKIAAINGAFTSAVTNVPLPHRWPHALEYVYQKRSEFGVNISAQDRFNPVLVGDEEERDIFETRPNMREPALASYNAFRQWQTSGGSGTGEGGTASLTGIGIKDVINMIFGTEGIFNMTKPENRNIHPLAQLSAAGRGLVEAAIRNIGFATIGIGAAAFSDLGSIGTVASSFMFTFATISMAAGFVLFYVIPLMPFMYFFFAVAGWVKGIFEAMVGVPLWALAHLRIDGDGIPGNAAMTGYMLILEIFLRPILILFGLLGSSLIFSALAKVLNEMWILVVENLTGFDAAEAEANGFDPLDITSWRSPIDEFFYTILYAITIYMIALASFKLVDLIPNFILRWMGQQVEAFGETLGDPAAQLSQKATVGFSATSSKLIGGADNLGSGLARAGAADRQAGADAARMQGGN